MKNGKNMGYPTIPGNPASTDGLGYGTPIESRKITYGNGSKSLQGSVKEKANGNGGGY